MLHTAYCILHAAYCAAAQAGITEVVFYESKERGRSAAAGDDSPQKPDPIYAAASRLLALARVRVWQHRPSRCLLPLPV